MKSLLCVLCVLCGGIAHAAAPVVTIDDNLDAIVDGVNYGKAGDCIVNNKSNAALLVAVNNALTAKLTAIKSTADAAIAAANAKSAAADKETARVTAIVTALKSVTMGPLPPVVAQAIIDEDTKKKAALEAQRAAIDADLAKLP